MKYLASSPVIIDFSVVTILKRSWSILLKQPALFLGLWILPYAIKNISLVYLAYLVIPNLQTSDLLADEMLTILTNAQYVMMLTIIFSICTFIIVEAVIVYAAFLAAKNEYISLRQVLIRSVPRFGWLLLLAILPALCLLSIHFYTRLLLAPAFLIIYFFLLCIPACVVEKLRAIASMKRSAMLTKGYRIKIFILSLIISIVYILLQYLVLFIVNTITSDIIRIIIEPLPSLLLNAFGSVVIIAIYCELRSIKEGVPVENLTEIP